MAGQPIRIEDLRSPILDEQQKAALAYGESTRTELSVAAVLAEAVKTTGLEDFGPDDFHARLALWLACADDDPNRSGLGRLIHFNDCARYAAARLRIRALLKQHPEIHDLKIQKPIIVVGLPR